MLDVFEFRGTDLNYRCLQPVQYGPPVPFSIEYQEGEDDKMPLQPLVNFVSQWEHRLHQSEPGRKEFMERLGQFLEPNIKTLWPHCTRVYAIVNSAEC